MTINFISKGKLVSVIELDSALTQTYIIGNGKANEKTDIILPHESVSRSHAILKISEGKFSIYDNNSSNGTYVNNIKLQPNIPRVLGVNDSITFSHSNDVQAFVTKSKTVKKDSQNIQEKSIATLLSQKNSISIGRDENADVYLSNNSVSRKHAIVEKVGNNVKITDLGSQNGTYINGVKLSGSVTLQPTDVILIGTTKLTYYEKATDIRSGDIAIKLINVQKVFKGDKIGLQNINLNIKSKSLVGIMGPSGCGKSTLLKAITGDSPATSGQVLIHGLCLIQHYDYIKTHIGYVPQDDIIHQALTVDECLFYSAKLRVENAKDDFVNSQIEKVLAQLNVSETRYQLISSLSGGQRKRISIAVELLNDPFILFLDEPTSPLDPQSVEEFLTILKNLAIAGTTVVLVTHKPDDLSFLDEVLFLGKGGYPVYFDKVANHLSYFGVFKTVSIYPKISDNTSTDFNTYCKKFQSAHLSTSNQNFDLEKLSTKKTFSFLKQLFWLTKRYANIKTNDAVNTAILLLQAPIIAVLIILIFNKINVGLLFLLSISAVWFGTNNAAREIVVESAIYKRERMYNLNIFTYLSSKIIVLSIFALIQAVLFIGILFIYFKDENVPIANFLQTTVWFWVLNIISIFFGLCLSAFAKSNDQVMSIIPIALIPQIMLAGVLAKINTLPVEVLSYFTISRWGTEGFSNIQPNIVTNSQVINDQGQTVPIENITNANQFIVSQFHRKYSNHSIFGDITGIITIDIIALVIIGILFLTFTWLFLKQKDSI